MSLTVWCRPNQFDCQSYLVNHSSLFNQSRCVLHLDLYLANCFFYFFIFDITKLSFRTINHSTQRRKKYLAKQTAQVIFAGSFVDGSGKLTCFKIIWHSFISHFGTTNGNKFKAGLIWKKKTLFGKILIYNILWSSLFSLSKFSFVITVLSFIFLL